MNPFDMLKNTQKLQEQLAGFQSKLGDICVTGSAGGGMVEVDLNGRMEPLAIRIMPEILNPDDVAILQDLIIAALTSAVEKARESIAQETSSIAGGLNILRDLPGFSL
jgi:DNA-binding YbaB/EbfC family protein